MTYQDNFDPDLHGDKIAPHTSRALAIGATMLIVLVPLIAWFCLPV